MSFENDFKHYAKKRNINHMTPFMSQLVNCFSSPTDLTVKDLHFDTTQYENRKPKRNYNVNAIKNLKFEVINDYLTNLLAWNKKKNILCIASHNNVFIFHGSKGKSVYSANLPINSCCWNDDGDLLYLGFREGGLEIVNINYLYPIFSKIKNQSRVYSLTTGLDICFISNSNAELIQYDYTRTSRPIMKIENAHNEGISGMGYNPKVNNLITGDFDGCLKIWNIKNMSKPMIVENAHTTTLKAITYDPYNDYSFFTGGGLNDPTLKKWKITGNALDNIATVDTKSQITSIVTSQNFGEVYTAHGFSSNSINIWSIKNLEKKGTFNYKENTRMLHLAANENEKKIAALSSDGIFKIWSIEHYNPNHIIPNLSHSLTKHIFLR